MKSTYILLEFLLSEHAREKELTTSTTNVFKNVRAEKLQKNDSSLSNSFLSAYLQ